MSTIKISQGIAIRQTLSPNMIQSFNILQMNAQELSDYVSALALENPMVELDQRATSDPDELRVRKLELFAAMSGGFFFSEDLAEWHWHENRELDLYRYAPDVHEIGDWLIFCACSF